MRMVCNFGIFRAVRSHCRGEKIVVCAHHPPSAGWLDLGSRTSLEHHVVTRKPKSGTARIRWEMIHRIPVQPNMNRIGT
ncbi:hypothetical protein GE061_006574 [Apolygus lucorum]|uniref:Uncharacterized protein n=1 Tax=Apolygus lucorum TaxID=248454 RepID=A0A6A4JBF9_APOLU|nr:hypothetical protein GE061_006574 [Apolygus lucorum]